MATTGDAPESYEMRYENETIWLTQRMMAELYGVDVRTVNDHLKKVYADAELAGGENYPKIPNSSNGGRKAGIS